MAKKRSTGTTTGAATLAPEIDQGEARGFFVPIARIDPSPFNPRQSFDEAELDALAETIRTHGLVQPIAVRPVGHGRFEIVAGERRWRAAKRAGLAEVPVIARRMDDRRAREIALLENLQRKDLSPVEEARAMAAMLDGDDAPTQEQLGRRLGCTQSHVANRLRLLRLPETIQTRINTGQLPATHARALVPLAEHPRLVKRLERELFRRPDAAVPSVEEFEEDLLWQLNRNTRPIVGTHYDCQSGHRVPIFTPTPAEEAQLDIVEVQDLDGKTQRRAANTKLWEKLQARHQATWLAEHDGGKAANTKSNGKPKPPTPEQRRAQQQDRARRFAAALWQWKIDWLRMLIAERLRDESIPESAVLRVCVYLAVWPPLAAQHAEPVFRRAMRRWDAAAPRRGRLFEAFCGLNDDRARLTASAMAADWFFTEDEGPSPLVDAAAVTVIAEMLEIDLADQWRIERPTRLLRRFYELHSRDQLADMAGAGGTKAELVERLLAAAKQPFPEEIARAKPPRATKRKE